ncbi:endonuclease/exonuclease/phosphatase family protein [uncultured Cellulomonas sp.]|uniref:endonuclease/exonuclease/phosphatase family protein n=1 Tax=uncultured Cellulomonas sp. TaxID=189682 RepID=UPI0028ED41D5|nr:endonuclease/exonuclease/phosphatase family protein [uncultured Cellulomonas sp.]
MTTAARVLVWTVAVAVVVVLVALAVPVASGAYVVAQLVSFRAVLGLGAAALATLLLAVPVTRRRLLPVTVALAVGALAQGAVLVTRSVPQHTSAPDSGDQLVVLSFNTLDTVDAGLLAALALEHGADVVVLPETSGYTARMTAKRLAAAGSPMQLLAAEGNTSFIAGTALLVAGHVGTYPIAEPLPTRLGSLRADPEDPLTSPVIVAAHPMAPVSRRAMPPWRTETRLVATTCAETPGAIVAGDLNATLDHPGLRELGPCVDAARAAGAAALGTWPSDVPALLAAPIDHVLVDGRAWRVVAFQVLPRTGGSDHRPVLATLARR